MAVDTPASIAILGAGPIGIEAALYARFLGYDVQLYERGRICENMLQWGHVRLFSPFGMNRSPLGLAALGAQSESYQPPGDEDIVTARQLVDRYLRPLATSDLLIDSVHEQTRVLQIGREGLLKHEAIGASDREDAAFRLLLESESGEQRATEADVVIDCTGTYGNNNWVGQDGIPALGETTAVATERIDYLLPDILGAQRELYAGQHTLLVGAGYSAATSVVALARLAREVPETKVTWITRSISDVGADGPLPRFANDPLGERDELARAANDLARETTGPIRHLSECQVASISQEANCLHVRLASYAPTELTVDRILALVGYRPDRSIYEELHFHECYATQGPIKLAAALLEDNGGDCLGQAAVGSRALLNPEANFYVLGAKSYGRNSQFLLSTGLQQIRQLFTIIGEREDLNLYQTIQL